MRRELTSEEFVRRNIAAASKLCKQNNYPYRAYPEDCRYLCVADLPVFRSPFNVVGVELTAIKFIGQSDEELRRVIVPGMAYARLSGFRSLTGTRIAEYKLLT